MTLPNNTTISLSQVNTELSLTSSALITMNTPKVRILAGVVPTGTAISMSNLWNKTWTVLPVTTNLYAWYDYSSWDNTNKIWYDKVNSYNAASTGSVTTSSVSGNGSSATINTIYVPTSAGIQWPSGVLPASYTMFHLCRYNGTYNGRIIQGMTKNWLDGFWAGLAGQAYHEGWLTNASTNYEGNNWVVSTSQGGLYRSNGVQRSTSVGGNTYDRIGINAGTIYSGEASDAHVVEVLVYDRELNGTEITQVESYFNTRYSVNQGYSITYIVTAGGGGGGMQHAGGGGGGGQLSGTYTVSPGTGYSLSIGGYGTGCTGYNSQGGAWLGYNGGDSSGFGAYCYGGGAGNGGVGNNGGSGGGGGYSDPNQGGYGTSGQGNNAARSVTTSYPFGGGGGGGAGSAGSDVNGGSGNWGGYSAGGGGGYAGGAGGSGGGGAGGGGSGSGAAASNWGCGGGGGGNLGVGLGGNGYQGLVYLYYAGNSARGSGGTGYASGGNYYHYFTSNGTFTA